MIEVEISVSEKGRRRPEYSIDTDLSGEISLADFLEFTKTTLIVTADQVLKEEQAAGFDKSPVVTVDNRVGKPILNVNPLGKIEFTSRENMKEIIRLTYSALHGKSPIYKGRYKRSHYVFLNGKQVANDIGSLELWLASNPQFKERDLIRFVNIQPYARKLERLGVTNKRTRPRKVKSRNKARTSKVSAPNGTYFLTARAIRSKYKRNSVIKFGFLPGNQLGLGGLGGVFKTGKKGAVGRPYLYPFISISVSEKEVL